MIKSPFDETHLSKKKAPSVIIFLRRNFKLSTDSNIYSEGYNTKHWNFIVPYHPQSRRYVQCISDFRKYYPGTAESLILNATRTRCRVNYIQFTDSQAEQLKQEDLRNIIQDLLNSTLINTREESIENLSQDSQDFSQELIEELKRMKQEEAMINLRWKNKIVVCDRFTELRRMIQE